MNLDEFGFFNQQLAGMLKSGIPLEGALRQLCVNMHQGSLRTEIEALASDLAGGVALRESIARRRLPSLYIELVQIGAQSNDLPGTLLLLADYYRQRHNLWTKLKALMVYPAIVLGGCLCLSAVLVWFLSVCRNTLEPAIYDAFEGISRPAIMELNPWLLMWAPLCWLVLLAVLFTLAIWLPSWRDWLRWRLPGFRESSLSQLAATLNLLVSGGNDLGRSLALMARLETGTRLGREIQRWQQRIASGMARFDQFAADSHLVPPLFLWLVGQSGEALAEGLGQTAALFNERARHRTEMMLYAALPVAVLFLGALILSEMFFVFRAVSFLLSTLGALGG